MPVLQPQRTLAAGCRRQSRIRHPNPRWLDELLGNKRGGGLSAEERERPSYRSESRALEDRSPAEYPYCVPENREGTDDRSVEIGAHAAIRVTGGIRGMLLRGKSRPAGLSDEIPVVRAGIGTLGQMRAPVRRIVNGNAPQRRANKGADT